MGPVPDGDPADVESTAILLALVRAGDAGALDRLFASYLPKLTRWAHGRLPVSARDMAETDDLVQASLMAALQRIHEFEPIREGAFLAYLRTILLNKIRNEMKRASRWPKDETWDDATPGQNPSTVERIVGRDQMAHYDAALETLPERQKEAVILRLEFGFSFKEIADAVESPSEDAARMMVTRALARLAEVLAEVI